MVEFAAAVVAAGAGPWGGSEGGNPMDMLDIGELYSSEIFGIILGCCTFAGISLRPISSGC
jgi:hypothetical protein